MSIITNLIYNNTPLNSSISKIIFNYINYTKETLNKLLVSNLPISKTLNERLSRHAYTIEDFVLQAIEFGYSGFWCDGKMKNEFKDLCDEQLKNISYISSFEYDDRISIGIDPIKGEFRINWFQLIILIRNKKQLFNTSSTHL
jgi:hypothetical protein